MIIKQLKFNEVSLALDLVQKAFEDIEYADCTEDLAYSFKNFFLNASNLINTDYYASIKDGEIVGLIAVTNSHIEMVYVKKEFRARGVAKLLWYEILNRIDAEFFTVESLDINIPLYKKLGFCLTGEVRIDNNIKLYSMIYNKKDFSLL